ncbi:MAG: caspase family protein [Myxococcales bacterium]|nr:caspase family protein [Myxococcales bacterium]MCB9643491.1 caspase family protein [Myxococcales bacterium]
MKRWIVTLFWASCFALSLGTSRAYAGSAGARETISLAFLFGQNDAGRKIKSLRYAETDVLKMRSVLLQNAGFRPDDIWSVRGATVQRVRNTMQLIRRRVGALRKRWGRSKHLVILLYYSGHARQGKLLLGRESMEFSEIQQFLRGLAVDVRLAIVDACESGPTSSLRGLRRRKESFPIPRLQIAPTVRGEVLISATGAYESAHEDPELRGGVFTHYLVSGLRGAADRDQDGKITLEEIYHYTYTRSLARTVLSAYGPQRAHFQQRLSGYGQLILAERLRPQAWLLLRRELVGDFFVWDAQRRILLAEINKNKGQPATLALAPGRYVLHWRHVGGAYRAPLQLTRGQRLQLRSVGYKLAYLRKGTPKGDGALWETLEMEKEPLQWSLGYTSGYGSVVKGMLLHGPQLSLGIPLGALDDVAGKIKISIGYQHHLFPVSPTFSFALHRLQLDIGFQMRLFGMGGWSLVGCLGGRLAPIFQVVLPRAERAGETLFSWSAGGTIALLSEHALGKRWGLLWGVSGEVGAVDAGGSWGPYGAISGVFGVTFSM